MGIDIELRALAAAQCGLVTRRQVRDLGASPDALRRRIARDDWHPVGRRVLCLSGSPSTDAQLAMAAVLDAGPDAVLSHTSAAHWWGVPGFDLRPVHVSTLRRTDLITSPLGVPHRIEAVAESDRTLLLGVPVVRPEMLVLQLCATVHPARAERALDRLWSHRVLSGASLRRMLERSRGSGVAGVIVLEQLLESRPDDYVPPASNLEARFAEILARAGLDPMDRQVDLGDTENWCGRVDFRARDRPVVIEVQSEMYHTALVDVAADQARRARLEQAGFVVGEVTDREVFHAPARVVSLVREVMGQARPRAAADSGSETGVGPCTDSGSETRVGPCADSGGGRGAG